MKLILYKDVLIGKFSDETVKAMDLRAVKTYIEEHLEELKTLDGSSVREVLEDVSPEDFCIIDTKDKTLTIRAFYPNNYSAILYKGEDNEF